MGDQISLKKMSADILPNLISARHWDDASFINLPMLYPSGAFVTVKINYIRDGIRVSDSGFAYREAESYGAGRSFANTARSVADGIGVSVGRRALYVDVATHEVERAILDISAASHTVAERIVEKWSFEADLEISDALRVKLDHVFPERVAYDNKIAGASSTEWEVSAIAKIDGKSAVFQTVSNFPVAVYKASTAFHDLSALDHPPGLVSVVRSKADMGSNLAILAQAGRVIEIGQPDEVFLRAAA